MKRALILGVGGMDGSHLAELLLEKGYEVHGLVRRSSYDNLARIPADVQARLKKVHQGDLTDPLSLVRVMQEVSPQEVYNMADQDEVGWSKDSPGYSVQVTYGAVATILEHMWSGRGAEFRFFQPISSTVFGSAAGPCDEDSPLAPASPYACAKAAAWLLCKHYRREHGVHVCCGVFFNHTSPRQKGTYLLPTIARQAVEVARGKRERIELNGPDVMIDVGWAPEYVEAAWTALQRGGPDDYLINTGYAARLSDVCETALEHLSVKKFLYKIKDPSTPLVYSSADPFRTRERLGWQARESDGSLVRKMVDHYAEELR